MKLARFIIPSSSPVLSLWATPTARISQTASASASATAITRLRHVRVHSCSPRALLPSCTLHFAPPFFFLIQFDSLLPKLSLDLYLFSQISRGFTNSATSSMPPTTKPSTGRYDYIIVGGGSGGSGSSVRILALRHTTLCPFCGCCRTAYLYTVLRTVWPDRDVLQCMARKSL